MKKLVIQQLIHDNNNNHHQILYESPYGGCGLTGEEGFKREQGLFIH